jgi:membrane fusion protein, heavy metal efflux system
MEHTHNLVRLALLTTGLLLTSCGNKNGSETAADTDTAATTGPQVYRLEASSIARHGIQAVPAQMRALRRHFLAPARVAFNAEAVAHVGTPLRGRVVSVAAKVGAVVNRGDVLLVVDSPDLGEAQIDFVVKRSAAANGAPMVELAKEDWERAKALFAESQGISQGEVRRREAEFRAAQATVRGAEAMATAAENRLHMLGMTQTEIVELGRTSEIQPRLTITAPFAGQVVARHVTPGELVAPDRAALLTIVDPSVLWVLAEVPDARLGAVAIGGAAQVRVGDGRTYEGKVALIAAELDAHTRTAEVRVEVRGAEQTLRPGMFAEVKFTAAPGDEQSAQVVSVDEQAVQQVDHQSVVFVPLAGEPNAYVLRPVEVGRVVDGFVPVLGGLQAGELVVTAGSFVLKAQATQVGPDAAK